MAIPYTQASMALVRAVDGTFISYPFIEQGDTTTRVYNLVCTQRASDYNAAQIDLDDNMSSAGNAGVIDLPSGWADSNAYFVGDTGHAPIGGGMISFTRTFANIPQSTTIASGSEFVTFPGILTERVVASVKTITAVQMTAGTKGVFITTGTDHGLIANDNINLTLKYTVGSDPFIHSVSGDFKVIQTSGLRSILVDIGHYWGSQVSIGNVDGRLVEGGKKRQPVSKNASTMTRYDYILPGVTPGISDALGVEMPPSFFVAIVPSGSITNTVTDGGLIDQILYSQTIPSQTEYVGMIKDNANIIIESSLSVWAGNILVMKTKTCKAQ